MFSGLMQKYGSVEVFLRRTASLINPIKKRIKRKLKGKKKVNISQEIKKENIFKFQENIKKCNIFPGDIVLIHSSIDGLNSLGMDPTEIVDMILELFSGCTVLFATFPIEPKVKKDVYKYNPKKTLCWTGMIPNMFLQKEDVIRSIIPYNSLASIGPKTDEIMKNNNNAKTPHGKDSPWYYCYNNHAKILFIGTTSRESNTMAIHMIPDIMEEKWPVKNWYEKRKYIIQDEQKKIEKELFIQRGSWYKYVNEYKTDKLLKDNNLLIDYSFNDIVIELVPDCNAMVNYLLERCYDGKLMYSIPRRFKKSN